MKSGAVAGYVPLGQARNPVRYDNGAYVGSLADTTEQNLNLMTRDLLHGHLHLRNIRLSKKTRAQDLVDQLMELSLRI